jgi:hypothetical protein
MYSSAASVTLGHLVAMLQNFFFRRHNRQALGLAPGLIANFRLGLKGWAGTHTLTYFIPLLLTKTFI